MKLQTILRPVTLSAIMLATTLVSYVGSATQQGAPSVPPSRNSYIKPNEGQIAWQNGHGVLIVLAANEGPRAQLSKHEGILIVNS